MQVRSAQSAHGPRLSLTLRACGGKSAYDPRMRSKRYDRHGRATRTDNNRRRRPSDGFRTAHGARFSDLVEHAIAELPSTLLEGVSGLEVVIEAVPPVDDGVIAKGEVPLVRLLDGRVQASGGTSGVAEGRRLVIYRRPLELRGASRSELIEVIRTAIGVEIAQFLGIQDFDDLFDDED
jgi:predicted Zn-dependent protease with MMP-like domain